MNRGNGKKVIVDAKEIARRLRETDITLKKLMAEYHCCYRTIINAVYSQIPQEEWLQIRLEHLARGNVKSHFQKGFIPWNKGKSYNPGGRSVETQFRKGNLPPSAKALGTITVHRPKRDCPHRMIAVAGPTPTRHKWIPYAQYLWEKGNGRPIPNGFFVTHADGNGLNDSPDNLVLTNRRGNMELMRKNNPGWRKKATKSLKKTCRIRRMKKVQALRKTQKEAEIIRHRSIKLQQQDQLEAEHEKMVEQYMLETYGLQVCVWECSGCAAEYEGENPPANCIHCGSYSFEKNFYRRKTG